MLCCGTYLNQKLKIEPIEQQTSKDETGNKFLSKMMNIDEKARFF
jgi:hypothetical protein